MMNRALAFYAVLLLGCGGSSDVVDVSPFLGLWTGTATVTINSQPSTVVNKSFSLTEFQPGIVNIGGYCPDGSGPIGIVRSATLVDVGLITCPDATINGCANATMDGAGDDGSLSQGTLSFSIRGQIRGCGNTSQILTVFTGTKRQ
jgi:hypothetical protein